MDSARNIRNPLTVGYAAVLSTWIVAGDTIERAARKDELGSRFLALLGYLGAAGEFALYTFIAAMIGSLFWNAGVGRLVAWISQVANHPDWQELVDDAVFEVRQYEEYDVVSANAPEPRISRWASAKHTVPSPQHGLYLRSRVEERERTAAEMSFRTTLAVSLIPVTVCLGIEGGGFWWLTLTMIPALWIDVALLKHTTLRTVSRFELEDLTEQLIRAQRDLEQAEKQLQVAGNADAIAQSMAEIEKEITSIEEQIAETEKYTKSRISRTFAFILGPGPASSSED